MISQKWLRAPALLYCLVLLNSCSSVGVKTDFDKSTDFAKYKSFAWEITEPPKTAGIPINIEVRREFRRVVAAALTTKGLAQSTQETADLLVRLKGEIRKRELRESGRADRDGAPYIFQPELGASGERYDDSYGGYSRGVLTIEMFDRNKDKVVWSGSAKAVINEDDSTESQVRRFVDAIMDKFPPKR